MYIIARPSKKNKTAKSPSSRRGFAIKTDHFADRSSFMEYNSGHHKCAGCIMTANYLLLTRSTASCQPDSRLLLSSAPMAG